MGEPGKKKKMIRAKEISSDSFLVRGEQAEKTEEERKKENAGWTG